MAAKDFRLFIPPCNYKRVFRGFTLKVCEVSGRSQFSQTFFFLVLLGPKVPKASARRFPRECASRGAARGAQDQAYAPPRGGRAAARPLFFRVNRECGFIVPPTAAFFILFGNAPRHSFPARRVPTWFRWRKSGRRADSDSGGYGLLANPRSRPTPLSDFRTSKSESDGWLLLLFATEKQRKKSFSGSCKRTSRGFLLLFATEKQRKRDSFLLLFWRLQYQKTRQVGFRGRVRPKTPRGARQIKHTRNAAADPPQR